MIVGIGTDLVEIDAHRAARSTRWGERFARKILVDRELERFARHRKPAHYLAKRFAAKEAFSKAMGTGIRFPVNWQNVGVVESRRGQAGAASFRRRWRRCSSARGIAGRAREPHRRARHGRGVRRPGRSRAHDA